MLTTPSAAFVGHGSTRAEAASPPEMWAMAAWTVPAYSYWLDLASNMPW
jgi:hypothetical protein